jgi:hypothetical protein
MNLPRIATPRRRTRRKAKEFSSTRASPVPVLEDTGETPVPGKISHILFFFFASAFAFFAPSGLISSEPVLF